MVKLLILAFLVLLFYCHECLAQQKNDACIQDLIKKQPKVRSRFNTSELAHLCNHFTVWTDKAKSTPESQRKPKFTQGQRQYVELIEKCKDDQKKCLQQCVINRCANMNKPPSQRGATTYQLPNWSEAKWKQECGKIKEKPDNDESRGKGKGKNGKGRKRRQIYVPRRTTTTTTTTTTAPPTPRRIVYFRPITTTRPPTTTTKRYVPTTTPKTTTAKTTTAKGKGTTKLLTTTSSTTRGASTPAPTPASTAVPTPASTAAPTPASTAVPTPASTAAPTPASTAAPTPASTAAPTPASTAAPTPASTAAPTPASTAAPTPASTAAPTPASTAAPTPASTAAPTPASTAAPTPASTAAPTTPVAATTTAAPMTTTTPPKNGTGLSIEDLELRVERKEYRMMPDAERREFHEALNELKTSMIDGVSKYDLLVSYHTPDIAPGAHWGPAFLPFHREYLKQFEVAIRTANEDGRYLDAYVPYWDSTLDDGLPEPAASVLWTPQFLGNGNGEVTTGPFANWRATAPFDGHSTLFREVGVLDSGGLYQPIDIDFALSRPTYADFTYCVDPMFELTHGLPHMFVGGHMVDLFMSPNDPSFMMHHAFVDLIWELWRTSKPRAEREGGYPSNANSCNNFQFANSRMLPFPIRNVEGLSNNYTDALYTYAPRPTCSQANPNCGSQYVFCNVRTSRCHSKVRIGGSCVGFESTEICLGGTCRNGVCVAASARQLTADN